MCAQRKPNRVLSGVLCCNKPSLGLAPHLQYSIKSRVHGACVQLVHGCSRPLKEWGYFRSRGLCIDFGSIWAGRSWILCPFPLLWGPGGHIFRLFLAFGYAEVPRSVSNLRQSRLASLVFVCFSVPTLEHGPFRGSASSLRSSTLEQHASCTSPGNGAASVLGSAYRTWERKRQLLRSELFDSFSRYRYLYEGNFCIALCRNDRLIGHILFLVQVCCSMFSYS